MEHIYIIDDDNKEFDHMPDLNENVSNLINGNVCKMRKADVLYESYQQT